MVLPIEGQLSLMQVISAMEMLQSAQREQVVVTGRHEQRTEQIKDIYEKTVTPDEAAEGKVIRDEDPRKNRERRQMPKRDSDEDPDAPPAPEIDILV